MKEYIGTKIVQAEPAWKLDNGVVLPKRLVGHVKTAQDGYKVVYQDGYKSWSPKAVFEEAYREIRLEPSGEISKEDLAERIQNTNELFAASGYEDNPVTDAEWAAMEKYPPVPLSVYQEIEKKAGDDYFAALAARPGAPVVTSDAACALWEHAVEVNIAAEINHRGVLPFEVRHDGLFVILPKNRRKIEGDFVVVAK